jgi:hypothetical protein
VSPEICEEIAEMRRKIQKISKKRIIFTDEVGVKLNETEGFTLVFPGEKAYLEATDTTSYAARYDMIAFCNGEQVLVPFIITPEDRKRQGVSGITKKLLHISIQQLFAQALGGLNEYPLFIIADKASIHKKDLLDAFHEMGCQDVKDVWLMPNQAAKRMSPLDNSLFHYWKERVRKHAPLTLSNVVQIMSDEWNKLSSELIHSQFRKSLLLRRQDPYADCPEPASHQHNNQT